MSCIISGEYRPPPLLGSSLAQTQKLSWVAKDNEAVTLDWRMESVVPLCHPFTLPTPSMLHDILHGKQEQRSLLISVLTHRHYDTTPDMKTHVAGGYTSCSRFDVETGKYIDANNTGHSKKLFTQPSNCGAQALHTLKKVCLTKLCQLNCSPALPCCYWSHQSHIKGHLV